MLQGRKDDLLVHTNGEETNAFPLQMALNACPLIHSAAVFGHGRPCTSAIVQPRRPTDDRGVDERAIVAAVEQCCQ